MTEQNKNNISIPIAIVIAGIIIAVAIVYNPKSEKRIDKKKIADRTPGVEEQINPSVSSDDRIRGNPEAPVTIVEFSDFQCPFCARFHPTLKKVLEEYPGKVRWAYKHFPLDSIHAEARPAAEASECVWEQGGNQGFWQFADGLFENQSRLGKSLYLELASDLGLDIDDFEDCVDSRKYKDKVEADYQEGISLGVDGTPGNFLNGQPISGAVPYETLKAAVERALSNL